MPDQKIILIAEDLDDDIALIRRAFEKVTALGALLHFVRNGEEAIAYLGGEGKYASREEYPLPDLLLLDLKMPRKDGYDVIRWVRNQPGLKTLRVIVLTSSRALHDVNLAYELGANSFLVKPLDFEDFTATANVLRDYWLVRNEAPSISRAPKSEQINPN
jgi:CheY-like chemotaxis protein